MNEALEQSLSDSLEMPKSLLPYVPFLLQDLWALGSSVQAIIKTVKSLRLPAGKIRVLDLGCGKGAVSVQLAKALCFSVVGVDAMEPFLQDARMKADEYGVSHQCRFLNCGIKAFLRETHTFDFAIMASLGGIFGTWKQTVAALRSRIRAGGYMIIDDGYLRSKPSLNRVHYEHYRDHETTIRFLTAFNDRLLKEVNTTKESIGVNEIYLLAIEKKGRTLMTRQLDLAEDIEAYLKGQKEECNIIGQEIEGAIWVLQKAS